ncbi:MAG TPA: PT domain-containing protein [Mycobacterium sp.]|nr:PT domain-containing protein [Mycobacterium sp.]
MSDQRYDASETAVVATSAAAVVGRSPRVGYVPVRANRVRDGVAIALLVVALLLPWNLDFGLGVPGSDGSLFLLVIVVTVLAILAALMPHVGPFRLTAADENVRRTSRVRLLLGIPYYVIAAGFVLYQIRETWNNGGTGLVAPGVGPGLLLGLGGAALASQPPITSVTLEDNGFRRSYAAARTLGVLSIVLATLSVAFNLYWRLRYLFLSNEGFSSQDVAVIITTLLYGAAAMIALVIASRWLIERTAAARLATTALGASGALAATLVWLLPIGRDVDAFHGIAENTSTAAVGYEGYLFWAAAAALVAPTTLYAIFLIKPPTLGAYRVAAEKCLTLIAFWAFSAAGLRVVDYVIAWSLDLPKALYDTVAMTAFNVVTGFIARWLHRQLVRGESALTVIAAFSGLLFVFTVANLAIGVALAPRYAEPSPTTFYGNNLAQQITSTFDVTVCALSFAVLIAMLFTGPLAAWVIRRRETAPAPAAAQLSGPEPFAPPTLARSSQPTSQPISQPVSQPSSLPRIVRLKEDSTTVLPAETADPTAALRIRRRERSSEPTIGLSTPPPTND